ncbi:MAG: ArsI/CadI family heavy metal resistance metalloenzyme [Myxococcota bacterium]
MSRIHIAITTRDVAGSLPFYETLFGVAPVKVRDGYAKFDVAEPSVNFTLNSAAEDEQVGHRGSQHFGIQVAETEIVNAARTRLEAAGLETQSEEGVTCCYAVQDKIWAVDPDGHRWEIFVTHADADVHSIPQPKVASPDEEPCCAPSCCK